MFQPWMKIYNEIVYGGKKMKRTMCSNCIKKEVCKYRKQAEEFEKAKKCENKLEFIKVDYSCIYKDNGSCSWFG